MLWFPAFYQMRFQHNPNWLHSMWLGWVWSILAFPEFVSCNFLMTLAGGPLWLTIPLRAWATVMLYVKLLIYAPLSHINTENVTLEELTARIETIKDKK